MVVRDPSDRQGTGKYMATPAPGWLNIIQGSTHVYVHICTYTYKLDKHIHIIYVYTNMRALATV